jgi:hypothetical protein
MGPGETTKNNLCFENESFNNLYREQKFNLSGQSARKWVMEPQSEHFRIGVCLGVKIGVRGAE